MKMMWVLIALFVVALTGATLAQLQNENLLVTMPQGFKIGFQDKKGNVQISEMVPSSETVSDWTEIMVTVQIFFGHKRLHRRSSRIGSQRGGHRLVLAAWRIRFRMMP